MTKYVTLPTDREDRRQPTSSCPRLIIKGLAVVTALMSIVLVSPVGAEPLAARQEVLTLESFDEVEAVIALEGYGRFRAGLLIAPEQNALSTFDAITSFTTSTNLSPSFAAGLETMASGIEVNRDIARRYGETYTSSEVGVTITSVRQNGSGGLIVIYDEGHLLEVDTSDIVSLDSGIDLSEGLTMGGVDQYAATFSLDAAGNLVLEEVEIHPSSDVPWRDRTNSTVPNDYPMTWPATPEQVASMQAGFQAYMNREDPGPMDGNIGPTGHGDASRDFTDLAPNAITQATRKAVAGYARAWAGGYHPEDQNRKRNPKYVDFHFNGGDCTNFISQALFEGGAWPHDKMIHPAGAKNDVWYTFDNGYDKQWGVKAWIAVVPFYRYARNDGGTTGRSSKWDYQLGEVLQFDWENVSPSGMDHSIIITERAQLPGREELRYSQHTRDRNNYPLWKLVESNPGFGYVGHRL